MSEVYSGISVITREVTNYYNREDNSAICFINKTNLDLQSQKINVWQEDVCNTASKIARQGGGETPWEENSAVEQQKNICAEQKVQHYHTC